MQNQQPMPMAPKSSNTSMIVTVIIAIVLAFAFIGAAIWGFMQSSALKATRAELEALQADHAALTTERDGLSTDLASTQSELDATKAELESTKATLESTTAELETTKSDLANSQSEVAALQAKVDSALKYVTVLTGFWVDSFSDLGDKIDATGDSSLQAPFNAVVNGGGLSEIIVLQQAIFDALAGVLE